jgi:prophage antirepressor-like protein
MTHTITPFTYGDATIRTATVGDEPWFVAKDVCDALGISNPTDALKRLDDDERARFNLGRQGEANIVNEPGLYSLILASRKPEAKAFKRWITHEVLPAIRRDGGYISPSASEHQVNAMIRQAQMRMELVQAAKGIIDPGHLEAKARVILAQGLGELPELPAENRPLYTSDYLKSKNLSTRRTRSVAPMFGKRVKAAYVLKHGREPGKYPMNLPNGQTRNVYAYMEADRPLMDQIWEQYYSPTAA